MLPVWIFLRAYGPYVTLPFAVVVGFIGYKVEKKYRKQQQIPYLETSVQEERLNRRLKDESGGTDSLKEKKFVPKSSLERNQVG